MFGITLHNFKNDFCYHKVSYTAITLLALGLIAFGVTQYCNLYDLNMGSIVQYTCMGVGGLVLTTALILSMSRAKPTVHVLNDDKELEALKMALIDKQYFCYRMNFEKTTNIAFNLFDNIQTIPLKFLINNPHLTPMPKLIVDTILFGQGNGQDELIDDENFEAIIGEIKESEKFQGRFKEESGEKILWASHSNAIDPKFRFYLDPEEPEDLDTVTFSTLKERSLKTLNQQLTDELQRGERILF